jgi:hypothetical protein
MKTYVVLFQAGNPADWGWEVLKYTNSIEEAIKYAAEGCRIEEVTISEE